MPLISVVMSVYNGERYLHSSIQSILDQTFGDFEFIIIDDASIDNSLQLIRSFLDKRIRVIRNENNLGLAASLNLAIKHAGGEYIARQDADDISMAGRFFEQLKYFESHPDTGVLGVTTQWINDEGEEILVWHQPTKNQAIQETLLQYCPLIHGSTMMRKTALMEVNGYNPLLRTGQDYDLWLRISESWDIECLPEILYSHRRHKEMVSITEAEEQKNYADNALNLAVRRRLSYGAMIIRGTKTKLPQRLASMRSSKVADRFISWSAGARGINRWIALRFLLVGLVLDPTNQNARKYILGILSRKLAFVRT
jgi:glycosyltransferase involved in cell wall biosynthesis